MINQSSTCFWMDSQSLSIKWVQPKVLPWESIEILSMASVRWGFHQKCWWTSRALSVMPMTCWLAPGWLRWMRQYGPCQELSLTRWADNTQYKCSPVELIPHSAAPTNISCLVLTIQSQACWEKIKAFHFRTLDLFLSLLFSFLSVDLSNWNALWQPLLLCVSPGHAGSATSHYTQLNLSIDRHTRKLLLVFCSLINYILDFKTKGYHWLPWLGWQHGP